LTGPQGSGISPVWPRQRPAHRPADMPTVPPGTALQALMLDDSQHVAELHTDADAQLLSPAGSRAAVDGYVLLTLLVYWLTPSRHPPPARHLYIIPSCSSPGLGLVWGIVFAAATTGLRNHCVGADAGGTRWSGAS